MKWILAALVFAFSHTLNAATFKIFAAETPPFLEKKGDGVDGLSGLFGTIVAEKIKKSGKAKEFEVVWVPWKRALHETLKTRNGLFFPLARSADREKIYAWLGHLGAVESWFYATDPKIKLESWNELKKYRIGFLNGSMRDDELHKILGSKATNIEGLNEDSINYKKLIYGRIDLWTTQTEVFETAERDYKAKNPSSRKVYAIKKFLDQEVWIASAANMEEKYQEQIRTIFGNTKN
ncbi:hypothetical protein [Bdellovibrio sp. HCB337]|uniref:hypothetical protein n=1 Tax=Bdellovibrio sp. HCB337 TaxID=3394358 RepID=UPI0039A4905D